MMVEAAAEPARVQGEGVEARPARWPLWRNPWVLGFVVGAATLTLLRPCMMYVPDPPPVVAELPAFVLVDGEGEAFGRERLLGETTVVALVCAACGASDARRLNQLRELGEDFEAAGLPVRVWAFGVDPERDTPEGLRGLSERLGTSEGWWWTTGSEAEVERVLRVFAEAEHGPSLEGELWREAGLGSFGIVDRRARLRGFFVVDGPHGADEVRHRATHVLREEVED